MHFLKSLTNITILFIYMEIVDLKVVLEQVDREAGPILDFIFWVHVRATFVWSLRERRKAPNKMLTTEKREMTSFKKV